MFDSEVYCITFLNPKDLNSETHLAKEFWLGGYEPVMCDRRLEVSICVFGVTRVGHNLATNHCHQHLYIKKKKDVILLAGVWCSTHSEGSSNTNKSNYILSKPCLAGLSNSNGNLQHPLPNPCIHTQIQNN